MRRYATPLAAAMAICCFALVASSASAAGPPTISHTAFAKVSTDSATLEAEVKPEGKATSYHFEYGLSDCSVEPDPCTALPDGPPIVGSSPAVPVSAEVEGLSPGTTYHFRVLAKNSLSPSPVAGPNTTFTTYPLAPVFGPCPNDTFRNGPSAPLPDCRAYEQASPVDKNGADINGGESQVQAATDGGAIAFFSAAGLPGGVGAQDFETYLARRGEGSWSTQGVYPPASAGPIAHNAGWTPDLSQFFSNTADSFGSPRTFRSRSSSDGSFTTIATTKGESFFAGASADGSKVYFQNAGQLDPATVAGTDNLYLLDRDTDTISLAGVLPDSACATPPCIPPGGAFAGPYEWFFSKQKGFTSRGNRDFYVQDEHAISDDGSKAYFTASGGQLYLRKNAAGPTPETVHVSASQKTNGTGPDGTDANGTRPAAFMAASTDGSKAFFTSAEKLTNDATTGPEASEPPTIASANLADGDAKNLSFIPTRAHGLFASGEFLYWANPEANTIGRAKLKGSEAPEVDQSFIAGAENPQYVTVGGEYLYWTNAAGEGEDEGSIGRAKLSGGGVEEVEQDFLPTSFTHLEEAHAPNIFEITLFNPRGIAVDGTHIYWGDVGSNGDPSFEAALMRANLAGEEVEEYGEFENTPGQGDYYPRHLAPQGLAIQGNFIYASTHGAGDSFSNLLRLSLLDPRAPALFAASEAGTIDGLAADASHLYWANSTSDTIGRANLELGEPKADFVKEADHPRGLAVDASHLYWSANQEIPANPGNDLYRFDAATGKLSDLTVDNGDPNGAETMGILGASEDGSSVYYVANGVPDGATNSPNGQGESAALGDCEGFGTPSFLNFSGECNLYLRHGEETIFIARLKADAANWEPVGTKMDAPMNTARVSADGETLLFRSQRQLSAYDNEGRSHLYRYQLGEASASCISCNPTGAPPVAPPTLQSIKPVLSVVEPPGTPPILTRNLSADGKRVFFESADKLVAADVNGEDGCSIAGQASVPSCQDVYEWEAEGSGSCQSSAQNGGCLYLLSSGTSPQPAFFADASASGDDAFVFSRDSLVPQDQDQIQDVYDVRIGGGLASQHPAAPEICEAEGCKPAPTPPPPGSEPCGSACFAGPPNPSAKGRHGRAHRKKRHRKHKHQSKHHTRRGAHHNLGGRK